jgi:TP901 family phage tail tape measure protein
LSTLATLALRITSDVSGALGGIKAVDSALGRAGASMNRVGSALTRGVTLPIVAASAVSVKLALDYEAAFTKIDAASNASAKQIAAWKEEVLDMAGKTAQAPAALADSLFFLASAGLKTSQVMPTLEASAKLATAGFGELTDIAKLTANAVNAYSASGLSASRATDVLAAAVKAGSAAPEEFASSMGRVLGVAANVGVEFDELAASLAVLSNVGVDVSEGVTAVRGLLLALQAPSAETTEALDKIGISAGELRAKIEDDLLGALRFLYDATGGNIAQLDKLIPNVRALSGFFNITGQEASKVDAIFQDVANSTGDAAKAFGDAKKGPMFQFQQALAQLQTAAIRLGRTILPIATEVVDAIGDMAKGFSNMSPAMQDNIVKWGLILAAAGPVLKIVGALTRGYAALRMAAAAAAVAQGQSAAAGAGAGAGGGAAASAMGPTIAYTAAIAALGYALVRLGMDIAAEAVEFEGFVDILESGKMSLAELQAQIQQQQGTSFFGPERDLRRSAEAFEQMIASLATWGNRVLMMTDAQRVFNDVLAQTQGLSRRQLRTIGAITDAIYQNGGALSQAEEQWVEGYVSVGNFTGAMNVLRGALERSRRGITGFGGAAQQAGADAQETAHHANALAASLNNVRGTYRANVQVEGVSTGLASLSQLQGALSAYTGSYTAHLNVEEHHQGGLVMHAGGVVRMHGGGLRPDERLAVLQTGEFVWSRDAVNAMGLAQLSALHRFFAQGGGGTAPAVAPAPMAAGARSEGRGGDIYLLVKPDLRGAIITRPEDRRRLAEQLGEEMVRVLRRTQRGTSRPIIGTPG